MVWKILRLHQLYTKDHDVMSQPYMQLFKASRWDDGSDIFVEEYIDFWIQTFKLPDSLSKVDLSSDPVFLKNKVKIKANHFFFKSYESQLFWTKMSDFTIYRYGNCTNTTAAEAEDEIYISVDFNYLRDSKGDYCHETIMCGENYISLRRVFKLKISNFKSTIQFIFFISTYERSSIDCAKNMRRIYKWALSEVNFSILLNWRSIKSWIGCRQQIDIRDGTTILQ